jgi:phage gpG-like protein
MTISTNVPYAEVHNEGFRGTISVRPSVRNGKKVRAYSYKANIPKRKFMGHGKEVEKAQRNIIGVALANVFMPGKFKFKKA